MTDAQAASFYNNAKGIIDYLVWSYQISPMIVVGIHNDNRSREFIPLDKSKAADAEGNNGQAEKLRQQLEEEIFPFVDSAFRVNTFKALVGHSRGGAFVANTIFSDKHDMFNAYISISPGMHYLNRQILKEAADIIPTKPAFHNFYFCTYGTVGSLEAYFEPQVKYLDSLFEAHPNPTIHWEMAEMTNKSHWGTVAPSLTEGLLRMNRAYQVDQALIQEFSAHKDKGLKEQVDAYYAQQKEKLGHTVPMNAPNLNYYGNEMLEMGEAERAVELFDLALELNDKETRIYFGKAEALRRTKQIDAAKEVLKEISVLLEKNEAGLSEEDVAKRKRWVKEELEELENE